MNRDTFYSGSRRWGGVSSPSVTPLIDTVCLRGSYHLVVVRHLTLNSLGKRPESICPNSHFSEGRRRRRSEGGHKGASGITRRVVGVEVSGEGKAPLLCACDFKATPLMPQIDNFLPYCGVHIPL